MKHDILEKLIQTCRGNGYADTELKFGPEYITIQGDTSFDMDVTPTTLPSQPMSNQTPQSHVPFYGRNSMPHARVSIDIATLNHLFTYWNTDEEKKSSKNITRTDLVIRENAELDVAFKNFHATIGHFHPQDTDYTLQSSIFAGVVEQEALRQFRRRKNSNLQKLLSVRFDDGTHIYTRCDERHFYWKIQGREEERTGFIRLLQQIYNCSYLDALWIGYLD